MSTETETNPVTAETPAPGVDGQGQAPNDDISTEDFDRMEAPADDADEEAPEGQAEEGDDEDNADPPDDETEEVEHEGQKYRVPKALKGAFLMERDYRIKTHELGDQRRAHAEAVTAWEAEQATRAESLTALRAEHVRVGVLERNIESAKSLLDQPLDNRGLTLNTIDWNAFRNAAKGDEEMGALYRDYRARYDEARETLDDLGRDLDVARKDLSTKEEARLTKQREEAQAALAKQRQETGAALRAEDAGWTAERFSQVVQFANDHLAVTPEEMGEATDPRLWKMAHEIMTSRTEIATLKKALKQKETADNHERAQGTKPAAKPNGNGGANARDPASSRGDGLSTAEWMRRRNAQTAKA